MALQDLFFGISALGLICLVIFGFWRSSRIPPRDGPPEQAYVGSQNTPPPATD
jgi:hypothetical protein